MNTLVEEYHLPAVPHEHVGDRDLILFRQDQPNAIIAEEVTLEDAQRYCSREDTNGDGWFVGFDKSY